MNSNQVSIIIPCYNAARWIAETLQSCFAQTYRPIEIIIVDDGSSDNSRAVAEKYLAQTALPYQVISVTNGGASRARNIGWQRATGDWIQFLDADDLLHPEKITRQMRYASATDEAVALIYSNWQDIVFKPENNWQSSHITAPKIVDPLVDIFKSDSFIATGSQLYSHRWLDLVGGFDETIPIVHDVNLLFRVAAANGGFQFCPSNEPLFYYRRHTSSLSQSGHKQFIRDCLKNIHYAEEWLEQNSLLNHERVVILLESYAFIARGSHGRDPATFETAYAALKRLSPKNNYVPRQPRSLAVLTQLIGYRRAESVAARYRHLKAWLRQ